MDLQFPGNSSMVKSQNLKVLYIGPYDLSHFVMYNLEASLSKWLAWKEAKTNTNIDDKFEANV